MDGKADSESTIQTRPATSFRTTYLSNYNSDNFSCWLPHEHKTQQSDQSKHVQTGDKHSPERRPENYGRQVRCSARGAQRETSFLSTRVASLLKLTSNSVFSEMMVVQATNYSTPKLKQSRHSRRKPHDGKRYGNSKSRQSTCTKRKIYPDGRIGTAQRIRLACWTMTHEVYYTNLHPPFRSNIFLEVFF